MDSMRQMEGGCWGYPKFDKVQHFKILSRFTASHLFYPPIVRYGIP